MDYAVSKGWFSASEGIETYDGSYSVPLALELIPFVAKISPVETDRIREEKINLRFFYYVWFRGSIVKLCLNLVSISPSIL